MIKPEAIPQFTGDLGQLEKDYGSLKTDAGHIRGTGSDVHTQFQGLSAYYQAPEAEKLFASTKPVQDRADTFADDLEKVSTALSDYATEVRPLVTKLAQLKADATTFVNKVKDDDDWEYDEDKIDEHNQLRDDVTTTVAAFWAAERTCHNKITALFGGTQMVAGDGSDRKDQYGFNADDLKNAKLPWGDPMEEKHHVWEVGHWVKSFVWDGLIVDGIWGTIKGLGTLVGFGGWDAMGQAWKGLAQLATGLAITSIPGAGALFWTLPDDKLPSWLRDSRTAMKETGKALVAWDEWGKNPGRAAGAVTFNVLTTVFTGGAGAGVSGAGKAGAVAKVLSVAGKAGKVIDPMTYIAKGAGAGLSKIGDITKGLKGIGNIEIPTLPDDAIVLPEGALKLPDGAVHLPEGAVIPDGAVKLPDGNFKLPDDVPVLPEGATKLPTAPGAPARYFDNEYNLLDENGNVLQKVDDARVEPSPDINPGTGADTNTPHTETPSPDREPALVGAGAHTADTTAHVGANAGDHAIRIGDSLGNDLGDIGRTGDNLPGSNIGDNLPGGSLGDNMPTGHAGDTLPSGGSHHVPGGNVGDHLSGSHADDLGQGPTASHEPPTGGHGDSPSSSGHDGPGGTGHDGPAGGDHTPGGHGDDHVPGDPGADVPAPSHGDDLGGPDLDSTADDLGAVGDDVGDLADDAAEAGDDAGTLYTHGPDGGWGGAGWVEKPSDYAAGVYESLRATPNHIDVPQMSRHTGVDESVLRQVKSHMIRSQHDVIVQPGEWKRGRFTPRDDIADLWDGARKGTLDADQIKEFKHLMTHEYVESRLMKAGLPYLYDETGLWRKDPDGTFGRNSPKSLSAAGAHDLAPNPARGGFGTAWQKLGLRHPKTVLADDLSNIDSFVNDVVQELRAKGLNLK
ncbi:hypothetical protein [Streptomyces sp. NBC_00624]|uniref:hypothetical protein n=1 Tax=Streptomyces sp. NBC_00624 TaxID=2975791 RepID=UPI0030E2A320